MSIAALQILGSVAQLFLAVFVASVALPWHGLCRYTRETLWAISAYLFIVAMCRFAVVPFGLMSDQDSRTLAGLMGVAFCVGGAQVCYFHFRWHRVLGGRDE